MRHDHRSGSLIARISVVGALCLAAGCSSDNNGSSLGSTGGTGNGTGSGGSANGTGTGGSANGTGTGGTGGGVATGGSGNTGAVAACNGLPFTDTGSAGAGTAGAGTAGAGGGDTVCTGVALEAERIPMDLFFMMDRSISMGEMLPSGMTRWEALHAAVAAYVAGAGTTDIGTGLGFFAQTGSTNTTIECDVNGYAQPDVGIGPLATTGPLMLDAMDALTPGGLTPTVPALKGAIQYAQSWATDHPTRQAAVALVSDGYPTQCDNSPASVAAAAADGYNGTPSIRTYVIGVGAVARFNLQSYAQSGGTVQAYTVDDGDVTATFVDTVANITSSPLACEFQIPPPTSTNWIDYDHVQIVYTPAVGGAEEVPYLTSSSGCGTSANGGWYYDADPAVRDPTTIRVCPCTCARFAAGRVDVRIGCTPRQGPR